MSSQENPQRSANPSSPESDAAAAEKSSLAATIRLSVLLAVLAVAIGLAAVDHYQFKPAVEAAAEKLTKSIDERNKLSIDAAGENPFTSPEDVQKIIGFMPTRQENIGNHMVEYYCWWGNLPFKKRFIAVGYEKRKDGKWIHIKHHIDGDIKEDDLPLSEAKALEKALKAVKESKNGPDRQMTAPALSPSAPSTTTPDQPSPPVEKTEPTVEEKPAPKEADEKSETEK